MAWKIVWAENARNERKNILAFWLKNNGSNAFSIKLDFLFEKIVKLISIRPHLGKSTSNLDIRYQIVLNYLIFYAISEVEVTIISILDGRENPKKLRKRFKKK